MTREAHFEILDISHESQDETAAVTIGGTAIEVTGTISGRNGCYTARLAGVSVSDGAMTVAIESYEDREDDEVCTEAIVYIDYEVTVPVDAAVPDSVTVTHNGHEVTMVEAA